MLQSSRPATEETLKEPNQLEEQCRGAAAASGIDGRTCFFFGVLQQPVSIIHALQDALNVQPERVEGLLEGFLSDRYADYFERRTHGLGRDCARTHLVLSQGYKRGLAWRGVPLGKTCWDVSIYQQLIQELRPKTVIELGTGLGASALFFLDHCRMFGLNTKIITLDLNKKDVSEGMLAEKRIEFIQGDVKNLVKLLPVDRLRTLPHPWLIVEDCHQEIPLIVGHLEPLMSSGDYLVIEDLPMSARGSFEVRKALTSIPKGTLMVDTFYTDLFGRNLTCAPDAIFRKFGGTPAPRPARQGRRRPRAPSST